MHSGFDCVNKSVHITPNPHLVRGILLSVCTLTWELLSVIQLFTQLETAFSSALLTYFAFRVSNSIFLSPKSSRVLTNWLRGLLFCYHFQRSKIINLLSIHKKSTFKTILAITWTVKNVPTKIKSNEFGYLIAVTSRICMNVTSSQSLVKSLFVNQKFSLSNQIKLLHDVMSATIIITRTNKSLKLPRAAWLHSTVTTDKNVINGNFRCC